MRAVIQRVSHASVRVEGRVAGEINAGLLVLLGVAEDDGDVEADRLAAKVARLRIFENDEGRFDRSVIAHTAKGNRPSFAEAAEPAEAERLYKRFCAALRELGLAVEQGVFGARMDVELVNDGPVTIILDAPARA